ncbi:hypothetical protein TWF730_005792 [Orbilia blumenaviensis]|uniref:Uncharacterized protein n=1 Tax=Orbilia blumenaviensis TaxID=1796055 RepID=A0AAV9VLR4_9PEZI
MRRPSHSPPWVLLLSLMFLNTDLWLLVPVKAAPLDSDNLRESSIASRKLAVTAPSTTKIRDYAATIFSQTSKKPAEPTRVSDKVFDESSARLIYNAAGDQESGEPGDLRRRLHKPGSVDTDIPGNNSKPTKTNKRYGDELGPQWFYESRLEVQCPGPLQVVGIDNSGVDRSFYPGSEFLEIPHSWYDRNIYPNEDAMFAELTRLIGCCRECDCLPDGTMRTGLFSPPQRCPGETEVAFCQLVMGCYCSTILAHPTPTSTSLTLADYQYAFNGIPRVILMDPRNAGYQWEHAPTSHRGSKAWGSADKLIYTDDLMHEYEGPPGNFKVPFGDPQEPFYLEGPGENSGLWRSLLEGPPLTGSKGRYFKRGDTSPANFGDIREVEATKTRPATSVEW